MTTVRPRDFYVADIPFTNGMASKKRPVFVLWLEGDDAVVASVTTAALRSATDVLIHAWSAAGLRKPSSVRLSRLDCLEQALLIARLGAVSEDDASRLKTVWRDHIRLQF
jgi:mRNA interferase MazF